MTDTLAAHLARVKVAPPALHLNLAAFPLHGPAADAPGYRLLDEAVAEGAVRVTEVSEGGHVPTIRVINDGAEPVLILDGEELVGAKQNRIVNLTILVPARSALDIPVSCVEAGRWHRVSPGFSPAGRAAYAGLRRSKMEQVSHNLKAAGSRAARQGAVWADIEAKAMRMEALSETGAMARIYERREADLGRFREALRPGAGATGVAFAIAGRLVGLDLFDHPATLAALYPKLVASYALDALEAPDRPGAPAREAVEALIAEVDAAAVYEAAPALGLGTDLRLLTPRLVGAALMVAERPVHLCLFRREGAGEEGPDSRFARAAVRRRWHSRRH